MPDEELTALTGEEQADRVRVPSRFGDDIFTEDESVVAEPDVVGQWDARRWHDSIPGLIE